MRRLLAPLAVGSDNINLAVLITLMVINAGVFIEGEPIAWTAVIPLTIAFLWEVRKGIRQQAREIEREKATPRYHPYSD